jgi:phosphatidylglycerophosphatase A
MREFLLTFFYFGKIKKAPGTFGSLAALVFWFFVTKSFHDQKISLLLQNIFWLSFLVLIFIYGCLAIPIYSVKTGEMDHKSIVLDEVLGLIFSLQITFFLLHEKYFLEEKLIIPHLIFCFVFFRILDIAKPSFIGYADRNFKNGFGVMFDDLLCGIVVAVLGAPLIIFLA